MSKRNGLPHDRAMCADGQVNIQEGNANGHIPPHAVKQLHWPLSGPLRMLAIANRKGCDAMVLFVEGIHRLSR